LKIKVDYPSAEDELNILKKFKGSNQKTSLDQLKAVLNLEDIISIRTQLQKVGVSEDILKYIITLIKETRNNLNIYLGASPRAALALLHTSMALAMTQGRNFVVPDDVQFMAPYVLGHRIILTPEAEVTGRSNDEVLREILQQIEVPR